MKISTERLRQLIKEELQKEIFGFGDSKPSLEDLGRNFDDMATDMQELFREYDEEGREENRQDLEDAADSFSFLQVLCLKFRDVVESGDEAGKYRDALYAMKKAWGGE